MNNPDAPVILSLRNVETFYGPIMAIRGVSLDVREGQIVTVLGANGAGKTTILKTISGIMDPQKGTIAYRGKRIDGKDPSEIVKLGISHVPEGREVFPTLSIADNLRMGAYLRRDRKGVAEDLEAVYNSFPASSRCSPSPARLWRGRACFFSTSRRLAFRRVS
jgi:branched-chain amino acid transport system ATP-binding protein